MTKRMVAALIALIGLFTALYLTLYKIGVIGTMVCAVGSCETVQLSRWSTLFGVPVAVWGVGYYAAVVGLATAGLQDRWSDSQALSLGFVALTGWGVLFSAWLTYLELFVIRAICQWCVFSAILATTLFVIALLDWREVNAVATPEGGTSDSGVPY